MSALAAAGAPAAAAVRPAAAALQWLLDSVPIAAVLQDQSFRFIAVNGLFTRLTGFTASDLIGRPSSDLHHPEDSALIVERRKSLGHDGEPVVSRQRARTVDGRWLTLELRSRLIDADGGRFVLHLMNPVDADQSVVMLDSRESFQLLFEESPAAMVIQDLESFRVLRVNRAFCDLTGYSPSELVGRDPSEFHFPEDRQEFLANRREVTTRYVGEGPRRSLGELHARRMRHRSGRVLHYRMQFRGVTGPDGRRRMLAVLIDTGVEIAAREVIVDQARRIRRNFELAPVGMMICDDRRRIGAVNHAFSVLTGYQPEEVIGRPEDIWVHDSPAAREVMERRWAIVTPKVGGIARSRLPARTRDGREVWTENITTRIDDVDGKPTYLSVLIDVAAEHRQSEELKRQVLYQGALLRSTSAGVAHIVGDVVRRVNAGMQQILGQPASALEEQPITALIGGDAPWRQLKASVLGQAAVSPGHTRQPLAIARAGGETVYCDARLRWIDPGQPGLGLILTLTDITDYRQVERERLDDALQQRDMLVSEVHHRIKNNLQGVAGLLQQIAERRPELAGALEEIAGQIQAIAQVHGLQVRDSNEVAPLRIIEAILQNLGRNFGVGMALHPDDPARLDGWMIPEQEAVPLALVINELGTNAIKHRCEGGQVDAQLSAEPDGLLLVIRNDGSLPVGFDFAKMNASPSGLGLVKAMLPRRGTRLTFTEEHGRVTAALKLAAPALRPRGPGDPAPCL
jgi:PAS domain S-box-containing protein